MAGRLKRAEGTLKALAGQQGSAGSTGDSGASTIGERLARRQRSVTAKYQEAVAGSESLKEAEAARLDSLESDNFTKPELPVDDDDEEFMLDEDEEEVMYSGRKRKKRRGSEAGGAGGPKRKGVKQRNLVTSLNKALELSEVFGLEALPSHIPTYHSIAAAPSIFPRRYFCCCCGFPANYKCPRCASRFCSTNCNETHKESRCLKWMS